MIQFQILNLHILEWLGLTIRIFYQGLGKYLYSVRIIQGEIHIMF